MTRKNFISSSTKSKKKKKQNHDEIYFLKLEKTKKTFKNKIKIRKIYDEIFFLKLRTHTQIKISKSNENKQKEQHDGKRFYEILFLACPI